LTRSCGLTETFCSLSAHITESGAERPKVERLRVAKNLTFEEEQKMKRIKWCLSVVLLLAFCIPAVQARDFSQSQFDGDWVGRVTTPDGHDVDVRIVITGNVARQFFNDNGKWSAVDPDRVSFVIDRNNAVMVWLNSGGAWSETQVFSMSLQNSNKLDVIWTRHVNNVRNGSDNETWNLLGSGTLRRV
jgi:hypothetical protein